MKLDIRLDYLIISKEDNFFDLGLDVLEELAEDDVFLCGNEEIETANENVEKFEHHSKQLKTIPKSF